MRSDSAQRETVNSGMGSMHLRDRDEILSRALKQVELCV